MENRTWGAAMHPLDFTLASAGLDRSALISQPLALPKVMMPLATVAGNIVGSAAITPPGPQYRMARIASVIGLVNNTALLEPPLVVEMVMANLDPDIRPFAAEAIGMGLYSRLIATGRAENLLTPYLAGAGKRFGGLPFTGVGMSARKLGIPASAALADVDGFFRWHVLDGYAFWTGRWEWEKFGASHAGCDGIEAALLPGYDRGLGRSAWFHFSANPADTADWAEGFAPERAHFIWAGLGVAATFTGGCEDDDLVLLRQRADAAGYGAWVGAGAIHGLATRHWCGCDTAYNRRAVALLSGLGAEDAASVATDARVSFTGEAIGDYVGWYTKLAQASSKRPAN